MFDDWDDDDLNLDEIFGKSQEESTQRDYASSRKLLDAEKARPQRSSKSPTFSNSSVPGKVLQPSKRSSSSSLTEQSVNVARALSSLCSVPSVSSDRDPSRDTSASVPQFHPLKTKNPASNAPRLDGNQASSRVVRDQLSSTKGFSAPQIVHTPHSTLSTSDPQLPPPPAFRWSENQSASPPSSKKKRRKSRFPGPAGCLGGDDDDDDDDKEEGENDENIQGSATRKPDSSSNSTPPDVDAECLRTLQWLVNSYARLHPMAERLLTSLANLDWLSQDLVYGSSLPDERVPLLVVAIKAIQLSTHLTVLRLRDADGNEMNGIVCNARVQDEFAEKLAPGSSLLLKDASAGYATRALVSQYVLLTQKTIAAVSFVDPESARIKLFVNPAADIIEDDILRLKSVFEKSVADRSAEESNQSQGRQPSLFQSEFDKIRPSSSSPFSTVASASMPTSSTALPRDHDLSGRRSDNSESNISGYSNSGSLSSSRNAQSTSQLSSQPPCSKLSNQFNIAKPATSKNSSSSNAPVVSSSNENLNFDLGCDIDAETLSQMLDDDF